MGQKMYAEAIWDTFSKLLLIWIKARISMDRIEEVKKFVKKECEKNDQSLQYNYHFLIVHKYAMALAKRYNCNTEVLELGVWLHDITRISELAEDHNITGAKKAEEILKELGCEQDLIDQVKHCIITHRAKHLEEPKSIEAKILTTADAMSHFDIIPLLIYYGLKRMGFKETIRWLAEKIERDWSKKMILPDAKEMVEGKYMAFRELFGNWIE